MNGILPGGKPRPNICGSTFSIRWMKRLILSKIATDIVEMVYQIADWIRRWPLDCFLHKIALQFELTPNTQMQPIKKLIIIPCYMNELQPIVVLMAKNAQTNQLSKQFHQPAVTVTLLPSTSLSLCAFANLTTWSYGRERDTNTHTHAIKT